MSTITKKIEYNKLSAKRQRFVDEYCIDFNGAQAAIRAGYSANSASMQAARLLANDNIRKALEERKIEIAEESKLKVSDVIDELRNIAFSDITQVVSFSASKAKVKSSRKLSEDARKVIASVSQTQNGLTVKMHDKVKALELLGRYLNIFTDRVEVEGRGLGLILNMNAPIAEKSKDSECVEVDKVLQDTDSDSDTDSADDNAPVKKARLKFPG